MISRNWSVADSSLVAQGAPGARNTFEVNGGVELFRDLRRPLKYPLRLGARYTTLPFLLVGAPQPREYELLHRHRPALRRRIAAGSTSRCEHVWRSQGSGYTESARLVTFGLSVRPGGLTP